VVQAGGAAVYGSDAIAGVINYVLKDDFQGFTEDIQYGDTTRNDYAKPSVRITAGTNFAGGRGNIAADLEMSSTPSLLYGSRKITQPVVRALSNPQQQHADRRHSLDHLPVPIRTSGASTTTGCCSPTANSLSIANLLGFKVTGEQIGGFQFSPDGQSVIPYNAGTRYAPGFNCSFPFCIGGEGYPYSGLASLYSGVQRLFGHRHRPLRPDRPHEAVGRTALRPHQGHAIRWACRRRRRPRLRGDQQQSVPDGGARRDADQLVPGLRHGHAAVLGKNFEDLLPTREYSFTTDTYRGVVSLDGDFNVGGRDYYYSAFYTRSVVKGKQNSYDV
jgi:iron complex outermembrane receptor protein